MKKKIKIFFLSLFVLFLLRSINFSHFEGRLKAETVENDFTESEIVGQATGVGATFFPDRLSPGQEFTILVPYDDPAVSFVSINSIFSGDILDTYVDIVSIKVNGKESDAYRSEGSIGAIIDDKLRMGIVQFDLKINPNIPIPSTLLYVYASNKTGTAYANSPPVDISIEGIDEGKGVQSIEIHPKSAVIKMGDKHQYTATVLPESVSNKSVNWFSSDNGSIVTIDRDTGLVTGVGVGTTSIVAVSQDSGVSTTAYVTVGGTKVTGVKLNPESAEILIGEEIQLQETILPADATYKNVSWSSSDSTIVSVSSTGKVIGESIGKATISVITDDGDFVATSEITVGNPVTGIKLNPEIAEVIIGRNVQLKETVLPEDASNPKVTWESSDISIGIVSDKGLVTGIQPGEVKITVSTEDGGYTANTIVTVFEDGTLSFSESLNDLNFQDIVLSSEDTVTQRKSEGPILSVLDTRWIKEPYSIQVSLGEPLSSSSGMVLLDALFFMSSVGESKILSQDRIDVLNHQPKFSQSREAEEVQIEWGTEEGILLKMASNEMIPGHYSGLLSWYIVSGP